MIQFPRRLRYKKIHRKQQKKLNRIITYKTYKYTLPHIITKNSSIITLKQIEAFRKVLIRKLRSTNKILIPIFPDLPTTAKPLAMRMGKGKGNFNEWTCKVKAGLPLFKFKGNISVKQIKKILRFTKFNKFSCRLKFF